MKAVTILLSLLSTALWGCTAGGGGGGGGTGSGGEVAIGDVAAKVAQAQCDYRLQCEPFQADMMSQEACTAQVTLMLESGDFARLVEAVEDGTVLYDGTKASSCISALKTTGCGEEPSACDDVFTGTLALGAECTMREQCTDGYCDRSENCPGVCKAYKAGGEACSFDDRCAPGYDCIDDICKTESDQPVGAACDEDQGCEGLSACVADGPDSATGTCQTVVSLYKLGEGASCDIGDYGAIYKSGTVSSELALCKPELSCVIDSLDKETGAMEATCRKEAGSGEACGFGMPDQCPHGEYCTADPGEDKSEGVCTKLPTAGQACTDHPGSQLNCELGLECSADGVCAAPKLIGESCTFDQDCASNYCDTQTEECALEPPCNNF